MVLLSDPQTWSFSQEVPWAEVFSRNVVFTLPTKELAKLNVEKMFAAIDEIVENVRRITSSPSKDSFRVVFGVEVCEEKVCGYPIFFPLKMLQKVFKAEVSVEVVLLTNCFASLSLPEKSFDGPLEKVISHLVACQVLNHLWPKCEPAPFFQLESPEIFGALSKVLLAEANEGLLTVALQRVRNESGKGLENAWEVFIEQISMTTTLELDYLTSFPRSRQG
jgi:hypothetical protein